MRERGPPFSTKSIFDFVEKGFCPWGAGTTPTRFCRLPQKPQLRFSEATAEKLAQLQSACNIFNTRKKSAAISCGQTSAFQYCVKDLWRRTLWRRSHRDDFTRDRIAKQADDWLPKPSSHRRWLLPDEFSDVPTEVRAKDIALRVDSDTFGKCGAYGIWIGA